MRRAILQMLFSPALPAFVASATDVMATARLAGPDMLWRAQPMGQGLLPPPDRVRPAPRGSHLDTLA